MSESTNDRVGQKISNYELLRLIGHGGFADVYLGEHVYLKTLAAVKILHARADDADQPDILNEARTIAQLEHPHIVRLFEYGVDDGYPFLIMSYAARGSLRNYYPRGSRLPTASVVEYTQQIASALDYAHQNKLIHRDVKPENMLIGQNEQLLLTDFGLVMMAQTSRSQSSGDLAGTVAYMAPEQLRGRPRFASDQYALGVVVYEWLCGRRPFNGSFAEIASQQVMESPPSLCELEPGLSPEIEQVVLRALAKNPADRFESVGDFARALSKAYGSPSQLTQQFIRPPLTPRTSSLLRPTSTRSDQSIATLSPPKGDSGETVDIPIDEALTSLHTPKASSPRDTTQMMTTLQPVGQTTVLATQAIPSETGLQTVQLTPIIHTSQALPGRRAKGRRVLVLVALILIIGGSMALGFHKVVDQRGIQISTGPASLFPSAVATHGTLEGTSTAVVVTPTATPGNKPTPDPVATPLPPAPQKIVPAPTPTSVPPTRVPAPVPQPPAPNPTPIQDAPTPVPTPDLNPPPTPDLNATPTPGPDMTIPTPPNITMPPGMTQ
jgi:serine/threonine protein kinase